MEGRVVGHLEFSIGGSGVVWMGLWSEVKYGVESVCSGKIDRRPVVVLDIAGHASIEYQWNESTFMSIASVC